MIRYNKLKYNVNITFEINKITNLVYKNGGKTYGGYVRDYLINKDNLEYINHSKDIIGIIYKYINDFDFQDIDIWFKRDYKMEKFVQELEKMYNLQICKLGGVDKHYPCNIYRYMLYKKDVDNIGRYPRRDKVNIPYLSGFSYLIEHCKYNQLDLGYVIFIDIAVSDIFPVNDFSINLLSFDGNKLKAEKYIAEKYEEKEKIYSLSEVLGHIKHKQLILLPDFIGINNLSISKYLKYQLKSNRCKRFIHKGYTLFDNNNLSN